MKLLVAKKNGMTDAQLEVLAGLGFEVLTDGVDYAPYTGEKGDIEAVICYEFFKHNNIEDFPRLRVVHLTSAGFDHMPLDYMRQKGIALYNARGVYSEPIAEFVLWGVLDLYKRGSYFRANAQKRGWRQLGSLRELGGKNVTILGAGSIASEIGKRFSALGCDVTALCRKPIRSRSFDRVVQSSYLDRYLPKTDIMVLAAPLNEESRHLFDSARFAKMKKGSILVNIARGGIVDTAAFVQAIEQGILSGAVMDVFETEPLPADSPIWDMENVIVTPHNAFAGEYNGDRTFEVMHRDLQQWLQENE